MSRWRGQRPPPGAIRDGGAWDLPGGSDLPERNPAREFSKLRVACPSCKFPFEVMAAPWSPVWAKCKCPKCNHPFEARTRESVADKLSEECDYQEDVRNQRAHPKAFSKFARTRPRTSSRQEIQTPLGKALVIEP